MPGAEAIAGEPAPAVVGRGDHPVLRGRGAGQALHALGGRLDAGLLGAQPGDGLLHVVFRGVRHGPFLGCRADVMWPMRNRTPRRETRPPPCAPSTPRGGAGCRPVARGARARPWVVPPARTPLR